MPVFRIPVPRISTNSIKPVAGMLPPAGSVVTTTFTARAAFIRVADTNFTVQAAFQKTNDTNFSTQAAFAATKTTTFTARAAFITQIDKAFTARAAFQRTVDTTFTTRAAFRPIYLDTTFTARAAFRTLYTDTSFTVQAAFNALVPRTTNFSVQAAFSNSDSAVVPAYFPIDRNDVEYELRLATPGGVYIGYIDTYISLDYTLVLNDVGVLTLVLPGNYDIRYLGADYRIEVWRSVGGVARLEGDKQYLIQTIVEDVTDTGERSYTITAYCLNHILKRRVVAYTEGTVNYATLIDQTDDMLKRVFKQNYSSDALNTVRNQSAYVSTDTDTSQGPVITVEAAQKNILSVMQEIAATSAQLGYQLFFDVVCTAPPNGLTFRTWISAKGADRRSTSKNPLILSYENGSIGAYQVVLDYEPEVTYVYAFGPGEGDTQMLSEKTDNVRAARGPFGRKETVVTDNDVATQDALDSLANATLYANRAKKVFSGAIMNVPGAQYGRHWNHGEYVSVDVPGNDIFDCFIAAVHVSVSKETETIEAAARSDA